MKTTGGKSSASPSERRIEIRRIDHGKYEHVATVSATSLRRALEGYFEGVLKGDGHHGPIYVGNHMATLTKFFTKAEYIAAEQGSLEPLRRFGH